MAQSLFWTVLPLLSVGFATPLQEGTSESCSQAFESSEAMPQTGQSALLQVRHSLANASYKKTNEALSFLSYNPSGAAAPLTEAGYASVADCCCQAEMLEFMRRTTVDLNFEVCNTGGLYGLVPFHTCVKGPGTYDKLVADLLRGSAGRCPWMASPGSCLEIPSDCPKFEANVTFVDCGCSLSKATKPNFPYSTVGRDNLGGSGPDVDVAEELRFVNVFGVPQPVRWVHSHHFCLDVSGGGSDNGNAVQLYSVLEGGKWLNQQWSLPPSGTGKVRWTPHPDKCLDADGTSNGAQVRIWDCSANFPTMQWTVPTDGNGKIFLTDTPSKCVDVSGGGTGRNGQKIQLWDCTESAGNSDFITPIATDATDLVITSLNAYVPPKSVATVLLSSGHCLAEFQYTKAECLGAAKRVGAASSKTSLDGGADGGLNGRPQGCTRNGGNVEWWGASDNAECGHLGFSCVCKEAHGNPALQTDMQNGFGSLALRKGTSTDFQFQFVVCGTLTPHVLEELHMAFYDVDKAVTPFKFYKFISTKPRVDGFQVSDIAFRYNGADVATNLGTSTFPSDYGGGSPGMAFDNDVNTKACCHVEPLIFEFSAATFIDEFRFTTGNDADGRDPLQWTLEGSQDQITWVTLHAQTNDFATPKARKTATQWFPVQAADGAEFVSSKSKGFIVDPSTSLAAALTSDGHTKFSGSSLVPNPTSSSSITDAQRKASVMFYYENVSEFVVTFGSEPLGTFPDTAVASLMFSSVTDLDERCEA